MGSVKVAYIVCSAFLDALLLIIGAVSPVYITPGYYWILVGSIVLLTASGHSFTCRINSWGDLGEI